MWKMSKAELALVFGLVLAVAAFAAVRLASRLRWGGSQVAVVHSREAAPLKVDVNSAPWWEIAWLPGVGEAKARAIVQYREEHGPFTRVEDLDRVPGISVLMIERMKDAISLGGASPIEVPGRSATTER